ncbi:YhgE/Pip domain-containing protein [Microbacterium tenebrionis]|uniref:YhgE/Pip domain-containing protein n=1 Tax=Microbacterium tenebrionis TaxID=2830665 RepID=UPI001589D0AD|nr:YhgE/Pip family protein [Microbacterium ihumii]
MNLSIERARARKPITLLTILGVLLLPAVIGGILVAALQNPTERLDTMTAAIVNLDEPVTIDDQYTPLGRQLAAGLVEGSDDMGSNLTWVISNEDDAAEGLADGSYQAVVTIPSQFSAAATSAGQRISSGSGTAEQATIQVTTPDDGLVADDLITSQIATVAASSMSTMLSEATTENILVGFTTIGDQIGEAANGADELANGARSAADGAAELPSGATQLADGAAQLGSGASELANGLGTIASGTRDAANGAAELGGGLSSGASALEQSGLVPDQLFTAAIGSQQATAGVKGGVGDLAAGMNRLLAACVGREEIDPVCIGLADMAAAMPELQGAADMASQAAAGTATGLNAFDTQATQTMAGQLRTAGQGAFDLSNGLNQLAGGVDQSAAGAMALGTGATGLSDGATALAAGAGELATGLDDLAGGNEELASGLHQAADQLPSFSDQESTSLASVIADPVTSNAQANTIFGPTAIPLLAAVVLWFGGLASFLVMRAHTARTLTSRRSSAWLTLGGFWPAATIGAGQGVLVALIVQIVASYDAATWWVFAGTAVLAGIAFAAVNQALVAVFGGAGRWVSALVGVVAIATGLISTVPDWLSSIGAMLPTAPAFTGLIAGSSSAVAGLIAWAVLSLIVTTVAVALRRTTSANAVLATA